MKKFLPICLLIFLTVRQNNSFFIKEVFDLWTQQLSGTSRSDDRDFIGILYDEPKYSNGETYDFIIIGSGSAGCVLANRLSAVTGWNILLLEVGEEANALTDIPPLAPFFQFTKYNWNYLSEREPNINLGMVDERMPWPRGRALGGTTIINYMIYTRGNRLDYDRWAEMGNPGWSYNDILKYFIEMERAYVKYQDYDLRGHNGELPSTDIWFRTKSADAFVESAQQAGHKYTDYNGRNQLGVSYIQSNTYISRRWSAEKAFLRPIRRRKNLKILTKARVTEILIDPQTNSAYGVKFVKDRRYWKAYARKEVILSAGALSSPQLLMLSGIGPKDHLTELGIPVVKNLPVGEKLYDHITFFGQLFTVNQSIVLDQSAILTNITEIANYLINGRSAIGVLGGIEAVAYMQTNVTSKNTSLPDMELLFCAGSLNTDNGVVYRRSFHFTDNVYNTVWKPLEKKYVWQVLPMLVHPKSYGYLKLKSKNPYHWPKFYGGYLRERVDVDTFIAAIREVQRIASMPAFQKYNAQLVTTKIPGCEQYEFNSDEYWECALRHVTPTLHHQVATCKMGPSSDPEAVVDNELRVYGVKNLRVADTSIIPIPLTAHTNIPATMVGFKAADLIKQHWLKN